MIFSKDGFKGRLDIFNHVSTIGELVDHIEKGRDIFDLESDDGLRGNKEIEEETSLLKRETRSHIKGTEVKLMDDMLPPWGVAVLEGPSVENIRSWYFKSRSKGAVLFHIPFDSFDPRATPESRARFGVTVVQVASFIKGSAIASLRPDWAGGRISQRSLPEKTRLDFMKLIVSQGFAWVEIEEEIEPVTRNELMDQARRSGSRIILTHKIKEGQDWQSPEDIDPLSIDAYRLTMDVKDSKDLKRMIKAANNAKEWSKGKKVMIEPSSISEPFSKLLGPIALSDMVPWSIYEMENYFDPSKPGTGRNRHRIWRSLGLIGQGVSKEWSLWKRNLTTDTMFFLQLGKVDTKFYRSRFFNSQFNTLEMDAIMVPWDSEGSFASDCLDMARRMGIQGAMVEMPMRTQVIPHLDWIDPRSVLVGGIDTISLRSGKANGFNSEIYGIGDQITREEITKGSKALIIGTGLSGRAAAVASRMLGMDTYIAGNNKDRTLDIAKKLDPGVKGTSFKALSKPGVKFDLVINSVPFETRSVRGGSDQLLEISDLVKNMEPKYGMDLYHELQWTPFLSSIESRGGKPISGIETLLRSSLRSFKLVTGRDGSEEIIRKMIAESILAS